MYAFLHNNGILFVDVLGLRTKLLHERPCMRKLRKYYKGNNISARSVYLNAGGDVAKYYELHESVCKNNSCALRVSIALSYTLSSVDLETGRKNKMGDIHFKKDERGKYNILEADPLRKYITRIWGEPDLKFETSLDAEYPHYYSSEDWKGRVKYKCGVVFYMQRKQNKFNKIYFEATHVGLIDMGKPYLDSSGSTNRMAHIWLVPCYCRYNSKCETCYEEETQYLLRKPVPPFNH